MIKIIPYDVVPIMYWICGTCFVAFLVFLIFSLCSDFMKEGCAIFSFVFLIFLIAIGGAILSGATYTTTITVCNKEVVHSGGFSTIVDTDQKVYSIENDPILDMKAPVGKTITARVYTLFGSQYPTIYDINGPVPCGNSSCGGLNESV